MSIENQAKLFLHFSSKKNRSKGDKESKKSQNFINIYQIQNLKWCQTQQVQKKILANHFHTMLCTLQTRGRRPVEDISTTWTSLRPCAVLPAVPSIPAVLGAAGEQRALPTHSPQLLPDYHPKCTNQKCAVLSTPSLTYKCNVLTYLCTVTSVQT